MLAGYLQFKPEFCDVDTNILKIQDLTADKNFDLLIIPELSNSGYLFTALSELEKCAETIPAGKFCNAVAKIAAEKDAYIVSGIAEKAGDKYFNSSILVSPDGGIVTYRKIHLFYEESKWFTPGDGSFEVHDINVNGENVKIGMMVCYDWIYPEAARSLALQGAQILCHPSNLVMPYCQNAMFARAVENRVFAITANRIGKDVNDGKELLFTGQSVIIDPRGNYLKRAATDSEECFIVDIDPKEALDKSINEFNSLFEDRRKEKYTL